MTITGRITADAVVNKKDKRKVVNFFATIIDRYNPNVGKRVIVTTDCNCSYRIKEKVAHYLTKGIMRKLDGRIYATPYVNKNGEARA
ncbi:MAG TPA: hypothetical protein VM871_02900 [Flavisolibacter sp.]|nr:hypothetical protein [Flavisolibacter sp.]